jgi:mono/diheme cytochrome c family protein
MSPRGRAAAAACPPASRIDPLDVREKSVVTDRLRRRISHLMALGAVASWWCLAPAPATADEAAVPVASSNPWTGDPQAIEAGRRLYNTWCSQCHGGKADGVSRFGKYAADLRKFSQGFSQFVTVVFEGRTERRMPPWDGVLDGEQVAQIGAYLETLAIEGANWEDY